MNGETNRTMYKSQPDRRISAATEHNLRNPLQAARFWDRMARRYASKPVPDQDVYARKLCITREYLNANSEVLEIGCGTGSTAIAHAPYVRQINASDFSTKMIDIAKSKADVAGIQNVQFACKSIEQQVMERKQYDAILALSVLHLLTDWKSVVQKAQRLLKVGGVFVTSTPCLMEAPALLRWVAPVGAKLGLLPTLSFFRQTELCAELLNSGFEIEHSWQPHAKTGLFIVARKS